MNRKEIVKLLNELDSWANPRIEVCYVEASKNYNCPNRCFAIGYLMKFVKDVLGEYILMYTIIKRPYWGVINDENSTENILCIPLEAIDSVRLLVPKVEAPK